MERTRLIKSNLSIVIPCYNPVSNWRNTLLHQFEQVQRAMPQTTIELVLVNDGSNRHINTKDIDVLQQKLKHFKFVSYSKNRGKGYAVRRGFTCASFPCVLFTDIDFPYTPESLVQIAEKYYMATATS